MASSVLLLLATVIGAVWSDCVPATPSSFSFTSEEHILKLNGNEFHLKGTYTSESLDSFPSP